MRILFSFLIILVCFSTSHARTATKLSNMKFGSSLTSKLNNKINYGHLFSQQNKDSIFSVVDEMPEFKGGVSALNRYLKQNQKHLQSVDKLGIKAKVYVRFIINAGGKVEQVEIVRTSYRKPKDRAVADEAVEKVLPEIETEALRLIQTLPPWNPGKQSGRKVKVWTTIPLIFRPKIDR